MNDEIKELLEDIGFYANIPKELLITPNITRQDCKILLDYITNLQQENERIKKMNMHEHKYGSDMEEKYLIEKTKNDRAVEYITNTEDMCYYGKCNDGDLLIEIEEDFKNDLLNILNGRSDK